MERRILNVGDITVLSGTGEIVCYGLGSCIGLFLYDSTNSIAGGAHIARPENESQLMIFRLIKHMERLGYYKDTTVAWLVGGGNVLKGNSFRIGARNVSFVKEVLSQHEIFVKSEHVGGVDYKTAYLDVSMGTLTIRNNKIKYTIK